MSDEGRTQEGQEGQQKRIQIRDTVKETQYANFFTVTGGQDAILLSFGAQFGRPDVAQVETKIAMSWRNVKRMAISLGSVIRRYEQQNGEIEIGTPQGQSSAGDPSEQ